jgi:Ca2+/Na+ antiporter
MHAGYIGAIIGCTIGLIGGLIGTYCSIKNTNGPRERAFMVNASIVVWVGIVLFLGLMFALPNPYRYLLWIPYSVLLPLGILYGNKKQRMIRQEEIENLGGQVQ